MAPRFFTSSFSFEDGESIPEHEEKWASGESRNPSLWHVNGFDRFSSEHYELASDLVSIDDAELLMEAAKRKIEKYQTASVGFHDDVYIVPPMR